MCDGDVRVLLCESGVQTSLGGRWDGGIERVVEVLMCLRTVPRKGAVVKTVMNIQAIHLPVTELSACRRNSCCLLLVSLSMN